MGYGRGSERLKSWLDSLTVEQKATIRLFATDMHEPFKQAIRDDPTLAHAVHDPRSVHIIKPAGEAVTELRFITANPVRNSAGIKRFLVLGLPTPTARAA